MLAPTGIDLTRLRVGEFDLDGLHQDFKAVLEQVDFRLASNSRGKGDINRYNGLIGILPNYEL